MQKHAQASFIGNLMVIKYRHQPNAAGAGI